MLDVSGSVMELFLKTGSTDFTVKELASHAGISERSFYRYFRRKEDVVKPFLTAGIEGFAQAVAARPADEPLEISLTIAWESSWTATNIEYVRTLYRVLDESKDFRAVWRQATIDLESKCTQTIAQRLGIGPSSKQAALAGAAVVIVARLATEIFADADLKEDPATAFASNLELLGNRLFTVCN
jgi:AcrR family transcriptional regulator